MSEGQTVEQIRAAVSSHFSSIYDKGVKSMADAGKPLTARPLLSLAQRVAKAVNHKYFTTFTDEWVPVVRVDADKNVMVGIGQMTLSIHFVLRRGMSLN